MRRNQIKFLNFNPIIEQSNLNIIFNFDKARVTIQCKNDEKIKTIINKFSTKAEINEENYSFIYNAKKIDINKNITTSELGIMDGQTIEVIKKIT